MSFSKFSVPREQRYFEDYIVGAAFEYGPVSISEADIVAFAKLYDPQPFHVDPQAAARSPFKGLIASGWHTMSLMMRLFVEHYLSAVASLASPGVDEVRWLRPVRPGDQLTLRITVLEAKPSRSKPDRGMVVSLLEAFNQEGDKAASVKAMNLLAMRPAG